MSDVLMNDAIYKFRRYEDPGLACAGINPHTGEKIGLYSTVIDKDDYSNHVSEPGVIYNEA